MVISISKIAPLKTLQQNIAARFSYDVHFTKDLWSTSNPLLSQVIVRDSNLAKSVLVIVDSGLLAFDPQLLTKINDYTNYYADKIELAIEPIVALGGEAAKNDPALVEEIHFCIE